MLQSRRSSSFRRRALVAAGAAAALFLAACGGGSSDDSSSPEVKQDGKTEAFPVTVAGKAGSVTIESEPQRVVALDFTSADALIALGIKPMAMAELSYIPGGVQEWTKKALGDHKPELFNADEGFPFETLAKLNPDVIVGTNSWPLIEESWDKLNAIAPVVGHVEAPGVDTWQVGVTQIGKAFGRAEQAAKLISDVEAKVAGVRTAHPEFAGKTVSFFNYVAGDGLWVISSNDDFSMKFMRELGFAGVTDTVAAMSKTEGFEQRANLSPEQYDKLEADMILGTSSGARADLDALTKHPLFSKVPAVARGSYLAFDIGPATSMAFPSALSLPYAVDTLVPQVVQAIAAGK
jgi:iron complex transport system substrate-binding protein